MWPLPKFVIHSEQALLLLAVLTALAPRLHNAPVDLAPTWLGAGLATVLALRDRIIDRWMDSTKRAYQAKAKRVYYLSLEFLIGRLLRDVIEGRQDDAGMQSEGPRFTASMICGTLPWQGL